ncbi:MAG: signal peptide peptidase SppA [Acidobacteriota bacterium]
MSSNRSWLLVLVTIVVVILLAILAGVGFYWLTSRPPAVARKTVIEVVESGSIEEVAAQNPLLQLFEQEKPSLWDLWRLFNYAARDDRVTGVYLEIQPLSLSWAQIEELRDCFHRFRQSGKPIHAFLAVDMVGERELYLASAADSITLNPDAALIINGLAAEVTFYKSALKKLGVKPQFIQFKEYKSPEIYDREKMSPPIREMYQSILSDLEERFISAVTSDRTIEESRLKELLAAGITTPNKALEAGLIDTVGYKDEVQERLRQPGSDKYHSMKASAYLEAAEGRFGSRSPHRVALVSGTGLITSGKNDPFSETLGGSTLSTRLREIRKDGDFEAVLLRVNSPGGSAVGSDMVWKEVRKLEEAGKPVVVSMSGVAGSGGYYISMGARRIISQPSTITGSIGVIFGKFNIEGLYDWLGMSIDRVKTSPNADLFSAFTSLQEDQKKLIRDWMQEIYDNFVSKAAEGRGMPAEELEAKARGRIYTGDQASRIGLVDSLGGFEQAVAEIKKILKLGPREEIQLVLYPKPKSLWATLTEARFVQVPQPDFGVWLERELHQLTTATPRVLMPQARID